MAAIRLVKIAKELNVGTGTIVDFLKGKGYDIENKPTSKISDEMHEELLMEFSDSMAAKEKADQLIIGSRYGKEEEVVSPPKVSKPDPVPVAKKEPEKEPEKEPVVEEKPVEEPVAEEKKEIPGIKVLGKIDLDAANKPKKKKEEPKTEKESPVEKEEEEVKADEKPDAAAEPAQDETPKESEAAEQTAGSKAPEEKMIRAKTPELAGLKIQGKIDLASIQPAKKPKKEEKKAQVKTPGEGGESRKKRKRKKIPARGMQGRGQHGSNRGGGRKREEEIKEVTQKEIDDKIKATMARMSGGGKKKRQKIRRDNREEKREKQEIKDLEKIETKLKVTEFISVSELASLMEVSVTDVITTCMNLGVIVSINQRLDAEIIELVATEFDFEVEFISTDEETDSEEEIVDDPADLEPRAAIVTVMGHVDHGKTSLLDYIREANVAEGEAAGITQHIGAYEVTAGPDKKKITFLDTPGHEAFTAMRARGAKVTDVAVIIVAADDKIMPQTKEAISHAQAAGVPIVFAINKIDKEGADPERIKSELAQMNFLVEDWGGTYQSQDISAKQGQNIDKLLEKIILESDMLELKANPNREAHGTVIEASLDKGRGYVTKMLVQNGRTLRKGKGHV